MPKSRNRTGRSNFSRYGSQMAKKKRKDKKKASMTRKEYANKKRKSRSRRSQRALENERDAKMKKRIQKFRDNAEVRSIKRWPPAKKFKLGQKHRSPSTARLVPRFFRQGYRPPSAARLTPRFFR